MKNFAKNTKILWAKKYYSAKNKKLIVTRFLTQNQTRYNGFGKHAIWCGVNVQTTISNKDSLTFLKGFMIFNQNSFTKHQHI